MSQNHQEHPLAYHPIPKGVIKEEPRSEENQSECDEQRQTLIAYPSLSHGVIKEESQSDDGHLEFNSGIKVENIEQDTMIDHENDELPKYPASYPPIPRGTVKEEIASEEDEDDCQLVAYAPLPYGPMKEELESAVGRDEHHYAVSLVPQQEGSLDLGNQSVDLMYDAQQTGTAVATNTFSDSPAADNRNDTEPPKPVKRKRNTEGSEYLEGQESTVSMTSSRIIRRSRPRGRRAVVANVGSQSGKRMAITEELEENNPGGIEQQQNFENDLKGKPQAPKRKRAVNKKLAFKTAEEIKGRQSAEVAMPTIRTLRRQSQRSVTSTVGRSEYTIGKQKRAIESMMEESDSSADEDSITSTAEPSTTKQLKRNLEVAADDRPYSCKKCGNKFKLKQHLKGHLMGVHKIELTQLPAFGMPPVKPKVRSFPCNKCERSYVRKEGLAAHLKNECQVDPAYPCDLCNYRAAQKSTLRRHLKSTHNVDRSELGNFKAAALKLRSSGLPFKCDGCGLTFNVNQSLSRHVKYECKAVARRPTFNCTRCNYKAARKDHLKNHMTRVHTASAEGAGTSHQLEA